MIYMGYEQAYRNIVSLSQALLKKLPLQIPDLSEL